MNIPIDLYYKFCIMTIKICNKIVYRMLSSYFNTQFVIGKLFPQKFFCRRFILSQFLCVFKYFRFGTIMHSHIFKKVYIQYKNADLCLKSNRSLKKQIFLEVS